MIFHEVDHAAGVSLKKSCEGSCKTNHDLPGKASREVSMAVKVNIHTNGGNWSQINYFGLGENLVIYLAAIPLEKNLTTSENEKTQDFNNYGFLLFAAKSFQLTHASTNSSRV